jgi:hypothetical protein
MEGGQLIFNYGAVFPRKENGQGEQVGLTILKSRSRAAQQSRCGRAVLLAALAPGSGQPKQAHTEQGD